jgi:hypothetical protein
MQVRLQANPSTTAESVHSLAVNIALHWASIFGDRRCHLRQNTSGAYLLELKGHKLEDD